MLHAFNNEKYVKNTCELLLHRIEESQQLFLATEVGGHLLYDGHASRVLPGFDPTAKLQVLLQLQQRGISVELVMCVHCEVLECAAVQAEVRGLLGAGLPLRHLVVTRCCCRSSSKDHHHHHQHHHHADLQQALPKVSIHRHPFIPGYPDAEAALAAFRELPRLPLEADLVVVVGLTANAGKLATCLSQLHHSPRARYCKLELFPIWNLPVDAPVNVAYEAATADIGDFCVVDRFHDSQATNYNRDVDAFPILRSLMSRVASPEILDKYYLSPTSMGVNVAGFCIESPTQVAVACQNEIARRSFEYQARADDSSSQACRKLLWEKLALSLDDIVYIRESRALGGCLWRRNDDEEEEELCIRGAEVRHCVQKFIADTNAHQTLAGCWAHFKHKPKHCDIEWLKILRVALSYETDLSH